ncbi:Probable protein phosphatase 2C 39 [Linum perenne]
MSGKEIISKMKEKVGLGSSAAADSGKGKSRVDKHVTHGYHLVKGRSNHPMEDYIVSEFRSVQGNELGLFAIFDGHLSQSVPDYLRSNLFDNILKEEDFWTEPEKAITRAYKETDSEILDDAGNLGRGGSTAVTAILINCHKLVVANVGDSRAIISSNGDVARVDGQLAVARAFGDKSLKQHLSSDPYVVVDEIDDNTDCVILASDGLWKVMSNQEAVDAIKDVKDARAAAKRLTEEALNRRSSDDISCIVIKF